MKYLTEEPVLSLVDVAACCHKNRRGEDVHQNGLHLAAFHDYVDVVKQLIKVGCPLEVDQDVNVSSHRIERSVVDSWR